MKKTCFRLTALIAVMMITMTASADSIDSLSTDTTLWYNQTQQLGGIVYGIREIATELRY